MSQDPKDGRDGTDRDAHLPAGGHGAGERGVPTGDARELLQFPCDFPIKVMGARADGFAQAIGDIVRTHVPDFDPATITIRPSKAGNYLGLTVTIRATSREQLDGLYRALSGHPMVKVVL